MILNVFIQLMPSGNNFILIKQMLRGYSTLWTKLFMSIYIRHSKIRFCISNFTSDKLRSKMWPFWCVNVCDFGAVLYIITATTILKW